MVANRRTKVTTKVSFSAIILHLSQCKTVYTTEITTKLLNGNTPAVVNVEI